MKTFCFIFLLLPVVSYSAPTYICSGQYVDKLSTPPKTIGVKDNDFIVEEHRNRYSVRSTSSNYSSTFVTTKDVDGNAFGFDSANTLFMKNIDGLYSLTFTVQSMKDTFIALINCKEYH